MDFYRVSLTLDYGVFVTGSLNRQRKVCLTNRLFSKQTLLPSKDAVCVGFHQPNTYFSVIPFPEVYLDGHCLVVLKLGNWLKFTQQLKG